MLHSDVLRLLYVLYHVAIVASQGYPILDFLNEELDNECDKLYPKLWMRYAPRGNISAGNYKKQNTNSVKLCLKSCCSSSKCNVMFMNGKDCFHVSVQISLV